MKEDFTFISTSGKSVVNFIAVPYTYLNFEVYFVSDIFGEFEIQPAAVATTSIHDHSVLTCEISLSDYMQYTKQTYNENSIDIAQMIEKKTCLTGKKHSI